MNAVVGVRIGRETDGLVHTAEKLSYASINWIRFEGSPSRAISRRPLASQPPAGAPLADAKVVRVMPGGQSLSEPRQRPVKRCLPGVPRARDLRRRGM
jgi:hypothetical protein